jgi:hypothetical protein
MPRKEGMPRKKGKGDQTKDLVPLPTIDGTQRAPSNRRPFLLTQGK